MYDEVTWKTSLHDDRKKELLMEMFHEPKTNILKMPFLRTEIILLNAWIYWKKYGDDQMWI